MSSLKNPLINLQSETAHRYDIRWPDTFIDMKCHIYNDPIKGDHAVFVIALDCSFP